MGESWPGADSGEYTSKGQHQVLQGRRAVCPLIWQQDMEPHDYCLSTARGASHLDSLPDGRETQAEEGLHHEWVYPRSSNVLQECGMATILHYINVRWATIFQYIVDRPIYEVCRVGEWMRGLPPRQWWWEQKMSLDDEDADGANK